MGPHSNHRHVGSDEARQFEGISNHALVVRQVVAQIASGSSKAIVLAAKVHPMQIGQRIDADGASHHHPALSPWKCLH
jgi:hypothetical protein